MRAEFRFDADLAGCYGAAVLALPYRQKFGLWLHIGRIRSQQASAAARGVDVATTSHALEDDWFDALCPLEEQARSLKEKTNGLRAEQRALNRMGWKS